MALLAALLIWWLGPLVLVAAVAIPVARLFGYRWNWTASKFEAVR